MLICTSFFLLTGVPVPAAWKHPRKHLNTFLRVFGKKKKITFVGKYASIQDCSPSHPQLFSLSFKAPTSCLLTDVSQHETLLSSKLICYFFFLLIQVFLPVFTQLMQTPIILSVLSFQRYFVCSNTLNVKQNQSLHTVWKEECKRQ